MVLSAKLELVSKMRNSAGFIPRTSSQIDFTSNGLFREKYRSPVARQTIAQQTPGGALMLYNPVGVK